MAKFDFSSLITEADFFLFLPQVGQSPHLFFLRKKHQLKIKLVDSSNIRDLIFIEDLKLR